MANGDGITIAQGGSIQTYSGGPGITIGGNGVMNANGYAGNFIVYCAPTVRAFTLETPYSRPLWGRMRSAPE